ncbi:cytochrome P450 [Cristinia sonorae]|uniref:Cytochrome P450 n=1 Tax=Cristinia sonorae TaxID=1940300 RepID=A0A8K0XMZ2_9AGAR|nr:cytochrome P450 [Cristinia sonorae]
MWLSTAAVIAVAVGGAILQQTLAQRRRRSLPPGPKPSLLWGNLLDMPYGEPWIKFREWTRTYGPLVYISLPTQPTIILGSAKAAVDLLEKRSQIYSDRLLTVMDELMSWDFSFAHIEYGQRWRDHRRMFHEFFNQAVVHDHRPAQLREIRATLGRILESPELTAQHVRQAFVAIILRVVYAKEITSLDDDYIHLVHKSFEGLSLQKVPGAFWVEYFPWLKYIPSWFPGARFKRIGEYYKPVVEKMINQPFDEVVAATADGTAPPSVARSLIQKLQIRPSTSVVGFSREEKIARNVTGIAYGAGADTTVSAASSFLTAMCMYPEVQEKARAELDAHVGPDRLPDWDDYDDLIYIRAIAMEAMRWMPVVPLGLPHKVTTDDEYEGYLIPKGTIIISNTWAMLHDPEEYPEPERFNPDRFLKNGKFDPEVRDPRTLSFGYGRRVCPGRHLSDATLFIYVAHMLHVFEIHPGTDANGNSQQITNKQTTGLVSLPVDIPNGLKPRSQAAERLIRNTLMDMDF